jgi:MEMO1 family protein
MTTPPQRPSRRVRPPAVAGKFYPRDPIELTTLVESFLASTTPSASSGTPKALIAPHAGYVFSGPIAASAYARLASARDSIKLVVLLGPAHFVPIQGLAASSAAAFATPLGEVELDAKAMHCVRSLPSVSIDDDAHRPEHCLEVQLPFLQVMLGDFRILPLLVGDVSAEVVAEVLDKVWGGPETLVVVSSDLSHYLNPAAAVALDRATAEAIQAAALEQIEAVQACGRIPIAGLLLAARERHLSGQTLDLRNSGDTGGPRDRVVGYGAFAFGPA